MALYDRVRFTTATTGTGTITVGSAITGFRTPAGASIPDAGTFPYVIEDGAAWEVGTGTYTVAGTTVARTLGASSTGSLLSLTGAAIMYVGLSSAYLIATFAALAGASFTGAVTTTGLLQSGTNIGLGGTTPHAWALGNALEKGNVALFFGNGVDIHFNSNAYYDGAWKYSSTAAAAGIIMNTGDVTIRSAVSGTANAALTWVNTWTFQNAGHLIAATDNLYDIGAASANRPRNIYCSGNQLVTGAGGTGYGTGSGGTVTQATSKATGVTLNKTNGQITMNAAALAASTTVAFTLTNSTIAATDVVNVAIASGASSLAYVLVVQATAAGSCSIAIRNVSAGSLSEAVVINYAVLKAVTA